MEKWFGEIKLCRLRTVSQRTGTTEARSLTVERDIPFDAIYKAYHCCSRLDPGILCRIC